MGGLHFSNAWGEIFLGRNQKIWVLPGGGTDPGGHYDVVQTFDLPSIQLSVPPSIHGNGLIVGHTDGGSSYMLYGWQVVEVVGFKNDWSTGQSYRHMDCLSCSLGICRSLFNWSLVS